MALTTQCYGQPNVQPGLMFEQYVDASPADAMIYDRMGFRGTFYWTSGGVSQSYQWGNQLHWLSAGLASGQGWTDGGLPYAVRLNGEAALMNGDIVDWSTRIDCFPNAWYFP